MRALRRIELEAWTVRLVGGAFFVAGCGRILSWMVVGRPHTSQVVLMAIELALPFVIIPWQQVVASKRVT